MTLRRVPDDFRTLVTELAASVPEVEAILAPRRTSMRFAELPARLDEIRDALRDRGIGRGDRVVVVLPHGPEMAVCYLGVVACATFVPLNPDYTEAEFARYLGRLNAKALVVQQGHGEAARGVAARLGLATLDLIPLQTGSAGTFALDGARPGRAAQGEWAGPDDIAIILSTSGTTAAHKLVPLRHRHLLAYAREMSATYGLGPSDRCLHVVPMFHGHGLKSSLLAPLAGASGVVCLGTVDVASIFEAMEAFQPTWYSATAPVHQAILAAVDRHRDVIAKTSLRFIIAGSGRFDRKTLTGLEAAFAAPVVEAYSMSETGNLTSNPLPPRVRKQGTVGLPMFNEVRVVDESGATVGPNQQGEVMARGPGVFDGYLDDARANTDVFVDGWFRTGDLGCFDDDGYLTLTGRVSDVIHRGGEKIGPLEVEAVLAQHPAVAQACVFGVPHPSLGEEVAATVVPTGTVLASEEDILAFARDRLAPFKVPRRVLFTGGLPTGPTGKVDRRALARMCADVVSGADTDPRDDGRSPLADDLADLWRSALDGRTVRHNDDFFLAGGDSLRAAQLFADIRERFGVSLAMRDLFERGTTVSRMARLIGSALRDNHTRHSLPEYLIPLQTEGRRSPLFVAPTNGEPAIFIDLVRLLHPEQPVYGFRAPGMDGRRPPLDRMESMAAENITRLRVIQPRGPYYLAGACFGALVAYEMARQLARADERVALLMLLDPSAPFSDRRDRPRRARPIVDRLIARTRVPRFVWGRLRMLAHAMMDAPDGNRVALLRTKLGVLCGIAAQRDLFRGDRRELHAMGVLEANRVAARRYVPGPYDGPTILCLTSDRPISGPSDRRLDWLTVVPKASLRYIPGLDSGSMLHPPYVSALAANMNEWLGYARTGGSKEPAPAIGTAALAD